MTHPSAWWPGWLCQLALGFTVILSLSGCGLVALPFRAAGAVVQVVPIVGGPIGKPITAVGDVID